MNPFRCRMWDLHDRLEHIIDENSCREEINSFSKHGQLIPALGRPLGNDPDHDIELICGARRLFVARHLNAKLLLEVREMSDRDALIAMDIENRQRRDISPYERSLSFARWLRTGHFESQEDLAKALKISQSQVSRLLTLARLPSAVVGAFASPLEIREGWGVDLTGVLQDAAKRETTIARARALASASPRLPAAEVYRRLMAAAVTGRKVRAKAHDEVVTGVGGTPLFRVRVQKKHICILLSKEQVDQDLLDAIRDGLRDMLQPGTRHLTVYRNAPISRQQHVELNSSESDLPRRDSTAPLPRSAPGVKQASSRS